MTYTGDKKREYQRLWMQARRDEWIAENGPCAWCGSTADLEVDHKNRYEKSFSVTTVWSLSKRNPKRIRELAKCQVLCKPCHLKKNELESLQHVAHGNATTYRSGCRCDLCSAAQSERRALQRRWEV